VAAARKALVQARLTLAGRSASPSTRSRTLRSPRLSLHRDHHAAAGIGAGRAGARQPPGSARGLQPAGRGRGAGQGSALRSQAASGFHLHRRLQYALRESVPASVPAEQDLQPYVNGVRFTSLDGLWRSVQRRWRPTVSAQIVFELPGRNSAAHGRLVQEESSFETSRVQRRDLERGDPRQRGPALGIGAPRRRGGGATPRGPGRLREGPRIGARALPGGRHHTLRHAGHRRGSDPPAPATGACPAGVPEPARAVEVRDGRVGHLRGCRRRRAATFDAAPFVLQ